MRLLCMGLNGVTDGRKGHRRAEFAARPLHIFTCYHHTQTSIAGHHLYSLIPLLFALCLYIHTTRTFSGNEPGEQVEVCRSQHTQTWLGVLYAYKGLLLVVGVYMAYETRHVKIAQLNDSQYIGLSVYSVVITSSIVVVLANLIAERVTLAFMTITALIITSTTSTLCLLFVPKMHDIWGKGKYAAFSNFIIHYFIYVHSMRAER